LNQDAALTGKRRLSHIRAVLAGMILVNFAIAGVKLFYGLATASTAMQAAGFDSLFDAAGSVIGLIGIALAHRPADDSHPYGHAKMETIVSAIIGLLLLTAAIRIGADAMEGLSGKANPVVVTPLSFAVMALTLLANIAAALYERRAGKRTGSDILGADAKHMLSDALVAIGVIIGLAFTANGFAMADSIAALAVSLIILYTALTVFQQAANTLSDKKRIPLDDVRRIACAQKGVEECHRIRTRGTPSEIYVDFHILVAPHMTVHQAHSIAARIENDLKAQFPAIVDVTTHIEPDEECERLEGR
jgi:cation diffusion facilitator family transporter